MKKILFTYICAILLLFLLPTLFNYKTVKKEQKNINNQTVTVYDVKTNKVNSVNLEDYVCGVVAAEMPATFCEEALKAQSVAARTYIYYKKNLSDKKHPGAAICNDSTHCCAYYSKNELEKIKGKDWINDYYSKITKCVNSTQGEIAVYDNKPILAAFHSAAGGKMTESSKDVWGGDLPYLVNEKSEGEEEKPNYITTLTLSTDDFKAKVREYYPDTSFAECFFGECTHTGGGAVETIVIGNKKLKGTKVREIFALKSAVFTLEHSGDNIIFTVYGSGHGVGMSQYGANYMAQNGADYKEILHNYYANIEIINVCKGD